MASAAAQPIVRAFFDALNARDVDRAVQRLGRTYRGVDRSRSVRVDGRAEARADFQSMQVAFSDWRVSVQNSVTEEDRVFVLWMMEGVHDGSCLRIPPTHRPVALSGTALFTVPDTLITRGLYQWDLAGFLRSAKLLPDLPTGDTDTKPSTLSPSE